MSETDETPSVVTGDEGQDHDRAIARAVAAMTTGVDELPHREAYQRVTTLIAVARGGVVSELASKRAAILSSWRHEYQGAHGAVSAIARELGVRPQRVTAMLADAGPAPKNETQVWDDLAAVLEAHPNAWAPAVEAAASIVPSLVYGAADAADGERWTDVKAHLSASIAHLQGVLDILDGRSDPESLADAQRLRDGDDPAQLQTFRHRLEYRDGESAPWRVADLSGLGCESDGEGWWTDQQRATIAEALDDIVALASDADPAAGRSWRITTHRIGRDGNLRETATYAVTQESSEGCADTDPAAITVTQHKGQA